MSGRPHPESERRMHGPLQAFDLGAQVARLREEEAFRRGRNSITLRKGGGMSVVLLVMGAGESKRELRPKAGTGGLRALRLSMGYPELLRGARVPHRLPASGARARWLLPPRGPGQRCL